MLELWKSGMFSFAQLRSSPNKSAKYAGSRMEYGEAVQSARKKMRSKWTKSIGDDQRVL